MKTNESRKRKSKRHAAPGMTLIEIMVVIVILGMIASAVGLSVVGNMKTARKEMANADLHTIANALKLYYSQKGKYPDASEGLAELVAGHQIDTVPLDPWRHPYVYSIEGSANYTITSYGADGEPGGQDDEADLVLHGSHGSEQASRQ